MSFSQLWKKYTKPSLSLSAPTDVGSNHPPHDSNRPPQSCQTNELAPTIPRPWRRKNPSTTDRASSSPLSSTLPTTSNANAETPTPEGGVHESPVTMPLPFTPGFSPTSLAMVPPPETIPPISTASDKLVETWDAIKAGPKVSSISRELEAVGDALDATQIDVTPAVAITKAFVTAVEQTSVATDIKEEIDKFSEGIPALLKALDEVKKLHPVIGVVVLAFETVYALEQKRRDNEKKVKALYVAMKDMMRVLLLLENVEPDKVIAPDGRSFENQFKSLVQDTADDIMKCSNVCDAYMKKRLLAKVFLGPVWNEKLLGFVTLFAQRRRDFQFELTIHINQSLYKANSKLGDISYGVKDLDERIKYIFPQLVSTEEKRLLDHVQANGGIKAFQDINDELVDLEKSLSNETSAKPEGGRARARREKSKTKKDPDDDIKNDIFEDPNTAADKNWDVFSRKFEAQKNQIIEEISHAVERASDRVIQELKSGAHERIWDQSIYDTWVDMAWRGSSVKARHFVLALRDHYLDESTSEIPGMGSRGVDISLDSDVWAIKFIDLAWLQPISEAIDDDASGFISVTEVNRFTSSRPADWSLPHWLAFWAIGFRSSIIYYAQKIEDLFSMMEGIRTEVPAANRGLIDLYFAHVWKRVHKLTAAVPSPLYFPFDSKFKSYTEAEETRLSANLNAVKYIIDGTDTLSLITGVGRIEKTVFPLLYLLMKRHYEVMQIMRTKILNPREIWDSVDSIGRVHDAVSYRVNDLTNNFSHQRMDPEKQCQTFAYGIFKYFYDPLALFSPDRVRSFSHPVTLYECDNEDQNVEPKDILNYSYEDDQVLCDWVYDGHSIDDIPDYGDVESPLEDILGYWHGYYYDLEGFNWNDDSMSTILLEPREDEKGFGGKGWSWTGCSNIVWSWSKDESDIIEVKLKIFSNTMDPLHFKSRFYPDRDALIGVWGWDWSEPELETPSGKMEFRRIAPLHFTAYPSMRDLTDNKPRALWKFAIAAVRNDFRRENWSWSYFSQRRLDRISRISLTVRYNCFGTPLNDEEMDELNAVTKRLTSADACFYGSIVNNIRANTWIHTGAYCDPCGGKIGGARLFCVDCVHKPTADFNSIDLCCEPQCVATRIPQPIDMEVAHEPNHRLVKARIPVLLRQYGRIYSAAHSAFERVRFPCVRIAESTAYPQEEETTGPVGQETPNHEATFAEVSANVHKIDDAPIAPQEERTGPDKQRTPSHEPSVAKMSAGVDKVDDAPTAPQEERMEPDKQGTPSHEPSVADMSAGVEKVDDAPIVSEEKTGPDKQGSPSPEPNVADMSAGVDKVDDVLTTRDGRSGDEAEDSVTQHPTEVQIENENLPTCGNCKGRLSFPCWYCIFCDDDLFICAACDRAGVPKLMRSSGEHTEGHHLIRCQEPQMGGYTVSPTEQLLSVEGSLNGMQMQLDDLTRRMGDHNGHMRDLNGRVGDFTGSMGNLIGELTGSITSLTSRIADIELILNRLAGTANGSV